MIGIQIRNTAKTSSTNCILQNFLMELMIEKRIVNMEKQMDIFECAIPKVKLSYTNDIWNNMKLNNPWIIGTVTAIIQQQPFASKEEWKAYYFQTGASRLELLENVSPDDRLRLQSIEIWNFNKCSDPRANSINKVYGRTKDELNSIGDIMYGAIRATNNPHHITRHDCRYIVQYRILGETWNGLMRREKATIATLSNVFGEDFSVEKVDGVTDIKYEVDAEIFHKGKLIAGVQIKPKSYQTNFAGNQKAYAINERKNKAYTKLKDVPVFYIYSDTKGTIYNFDILKEIVALTQQEKETV